MWEFDVDLDDCYFTLFVVGSPRELSEAVRKVTLWLKENDFEEPPAFASVRYVKGFLIKEDDEDLEED